MESQCTIVVWYSGLCTKKHNKLTDTSIQVLCNAIIFSFLYWHSILGWYSQPCHGKWNSKEYWHYVLLACLVDTINNTDEDRLRIMHLAGNKKVGYIQRWSPFIMQLKFYLLCATQKQFVLYSLQVQCSLRLTTLSYLNAILHLETQKATSFSTKPSNKWNHCVIFRLVRLIIS